MHYEPDRKRSLAYLLVRQSLAVHHQSESHAICCVLQFNRGAPLCQAPPSAVIWRIRSAMRIRLSERYLHPMAVAIRLGTMLGTFRHSPKLIQDTPYPGINPTDFLSSPLEGRCQIPIKPSPPYHFLPGDKLSQCSFEAILSKY